MMKKFLCSVLVMSSILSCSAPAFAADKSTQTLDLSKFKFEKSANIDDMIKESKKADDLDWHYNREMSDTVVSLHFQQMTVGAVAGVLCAEFGGAAAAYKALAAAIATNAATESTKNVWFKTDYYWTVSDGSSGYAYYIKQVIYSYSDEDCTKYVGKKINYYNSNMTY